MQPGCLPAIPARHVWSLLPLWVASIQRNIETIYNTNSNDNVHVLKSPPLCGNVHIKVLIVTADIADGRMKQAPNLCHISVKM